MLGLFELGQCKNQLLDFCLVKLNLLLFKRKCFTSKLANFSVLVPKH